MSSIFAQSQAPGRSLPPYCPPSFPFPIFLISVLSSMMTLPPTVTKWHRLIIKKIRCQWPWLWPFSIDYPGWSPIGHGLGHGHGGHVLCHGLGHEVGLGLSWRPEADWKWVVWRGSPTKIFVLPYSLLPIYIWTLARPPMPRWTSFGTIMRRWPSGESNFPYQVRDYHWSRGSRQYGFHSRQLQ